MLEKNVSTARSQGGDCAICDDPVEAGERVVCVSFSVSLLVMTQTIEKELHAKCARNLAQALTAAADEAEEIPRRRKR